MATEIMSTCIVDERIGLRFYDGKICVLQLEHGVTPEIWDRIDEVSMHGSNVPKEYATEMVHQIRFWLKPPTVNCY